MKLADSITSEFQQGKQLIAQYAKAQDAPVHYNPRGLVTFGLEEPIPYWQALEIANLWASAAKNIISGAEHV
jgi:hypothetical protein